MGNEHTCPICGHKFYAGEEWGWNHGKTWFCSYSCLRNYEKTLIDNHELLRARIRNPRVRHFYMDISTGKFYTCPELAKMRGSTTHAMIQRLIRDRTCGGKYRHVDLEYKEE